MPTLYRPPAEAPSLVIRVADGCPCNTCTFCGMYKGVTYRPHPPEEIDADLERARQEWPDADRIFLADGDVMAFPQSRLVPLLEQCRRRFPRLARISLYANGHSIARRTDAELRDLRDRKLHTLYMGLESGHQPTLDAVRKHATAATMIEAARRAQNCGLRMSVMVLIGLAGPEGSAEHIRATADAVNAMQPRLLSALRVTPMPRTPLADALRAGRFTMLSETDAVRELRQLIALLDLTRTVFRADHRSNIVAIGGRLPRDRDRLLRQLDVLLDSGRLALDSPGPLIPW